MNDVIAATVFKQVLRPNAHDINNIAAILYEIYQVHPIDFDTSEQRRKYCVALNNYGASTIYPLLAYEAVKCEGAYNYSDVWVEHIVAYITLSDPSNSFRVIDDLLNVNIAYAMRLILEYPADSPQLSWWPSSSQQTQSLALWKLKTLYDHLEKAYSGGSITLKNALKRHGAWPLI